MSKILRILCSLAALALLPTLAAQGQVPSLAQTLRASRGRQRLLLFGAPTAMQVDFKRQQGLLATAATGLATRDINVLEVPYDQLSPSDRRYWTSQLSQSLAGFAVVLIGKDGGVKRVETSPLSTVELFSTVDKMPMRQEEMRRGK